MLKAIRFAYRHSIRSGQCSKFFSALRSGLEIYDLFDIDLHEELLVLMIGIISVPATIKLLVEVVKVTLH